MAKIFHRTITGLRWLLGGAVAVAAVAAVSAGVATVGLGHEMPGATAAADSRTVEWAPVADPGLDRQQAMDAAVAAVPGSRAVEADLDTEHGTVVWEVEVVTPDGVEHDVTLDASTGAVLGPIGRD